MNIRNITIAVAALVVIALVGFFLLRDDIDDDLDNGTETTAEQEDVNNDQEAETTPGDDADIIDDGQDDEEVESQTDVRYGSNGFTPATLEISVGDSVSFVNSSNVSMWVASDSHPTHTNFPDFDAGRGYGSGETYEFTFNEPGSYGYHNHLNPNHGGIIIVE
ncbi:MAG: plastocyanin/azurin family copper-binding protein [Candidatus Saccharimonadales bacterium]